MKSKIIPHLWFSDNGQEAIGFYTGLFKESSLRDLRVLPGNEFENVKVMSFELMNTPMMAIEAVSTFQFNASFSYYVYCGSDSEVQRLYNVLSENGNVVFPVGNYPWSSCYAWVVDKYGLSWQLDQDDIKTEQKIVPTLMFSNQFSSSVAAYTEILKNIFPAFKLMVTAPYPVEQSPSEGALLFAQVKIAGFVINLMSSHHSQNFEFNESNSLMVYCQDQDEIDYYWNCLAENGMMQACGWLKDQFGVSWQIVPAKLDEMIFQTDQIQLKELTDVMLKMVKLDVGVLERAMDKS